VEWFINASFAVQHKFKSHRVAEAMTMGAGAITSIGNYPAPT